MVFKSNNKEYKLSECSAKSGETVLKALNCALDLAGSKKGFSDDVRRKSIEKILKFLNIAVTDNLVNTIHLNALKTKSFTLRNNVNK